MKSVQHLAFALALAATLAAAATAQDKPAGTFEGQVSVNEVLLDVVVTDKSGNVIVGLGPDDFLVEEGGESVSVSSSTFYSNLSFVESSDVASRLGIDPREVPVDRYFILFFHDQRRLLPSLTNKYMNVTRRVEDWIFKKLLPNDWVAVVRYDAKLMVHTDFTTDNQRILQAVQDAARGKNPPDIWPSRLEEQRSDGPSLLVNLPQGKELRRQTKRIYSGFEVLADAAGDITGRKNLLFLSMGFGEGDEFGTWTPDVRYYDQMMHSLNDNNVAVYSISVFESLAAQNAAFGTSAGGGSLAPAGNAAPGLTSAIDAMGSSMSLLSDDTGGRYFFNFLNFETPFLEVLDENNGYYLLSYSSSTPLGESGYRKVEVKAKNPEFKIKARQGYRYGAG